MADDASLLDAQALDLDPRRPALPALPAAGPRAVRAWLRAGADAEAHPPSAAEVARFWPWPE